MKKIFVWVVGLFVVGWASVSFAETAVVVIKGTAEGSPVSGKAVLKDTAEGLRVTAEVSGVSPGKHGFHIHQFGACGDSGKAAGGHFNPDAVTHGFLPQDGFLKAHAGDLGNIEVASDGTGKYEVMIHGLSLSGGKYSVGGRSIVLHEKEDDFGQPLGNAGARIGCGGIFISESGEV